MVSVAAAKESKCLTSPGWGRRVAVLNAFGKLLTKLVTVGSRFEGFIEEFPCN